MRKYITTRDIALLYISNAESISAKSRKKENHKDWGGGPGGEVTKVRLTNRYHRKSTVKEGQRLGPKK